MSYAVDVQLTSNPKKMKYKNIAIHELNTLENALQTAWCDFRANSSEANLLALQEITRAMDEAYLDFYGERGE